MRKNTEWNYCITLLPKTLIDGTRTTDVLLMRRRINGERQYRKLTPEEEQEWALADAW